MKVDVGLAVIPRLAALFIRTLHATIRVRHVHVERITALNDAKKPYILSFWHAHLLMMFFSRFRKPMCVMVSQHRDGELISRTMKLFKAKTVRGSSTRGGSQALREIIKVAENGDNVGYTPDGPRGPRNVVQRGVVITAQMTGAPIMPVIFNAEKKKVLRSWDRMIVPRPFTRGIFVYGEPIYVPREMTPEQFEETRLLVETRMNELVEISETRFGELYVSGVR